MVMCLLSVCECAVLVCVLFQLNISNIFGNVSIFSYFFCTRDEEVNYIFFFVAQFTIWGFQMLLNCLSMNVIIGSCYKIQEYIQNIIIFWPTIRIKVIVPYLIPRVFQTRLIPDGLSYNSLFLIFILKYFFVDLFRIFFNVKNRILLLNISNYIFVIEF